MSSMSAYKWHLNLFCVEVKQTRNWKEMYSLLQIYSEKIEKEHEKLRKDNRWLQLSWRANGTNFSRLLPDTISEKNQKSKIEFLKTTCVALEKNLEKNLKLFSTSELPPYFGKIDQTFFWKKIVKKFFDKKQLQGPCASLVSAQLNFGRKIKNKTELL